MGKDLGKELNELNAALHGLISVARRHCAKEGWVQIVLFLGHYEGYFWRQDPKRAPGDYEGYGFLGSSAQFRMSCFDVMLCDELPALLVLEMLRCFGFFCRAFFVKSQSPTCPHKTSSGLWSFDVVQFVGVNVSFRGAGKNFIFNFEPIEFKEP